MLAMQMQSDFDKKEGEARLKQERKDVIAGEELKHQKQQRNLSLLGVALLGIMVIAVFWGYKQKQRSNVLLKEKNETIEAQKHLVEEKNKEITDSINYAKRLQKAILASEKTMHNVFNESFILYKPKDIVSGDFYWILHIEDKPIKKNIFAFAAADCTGHGVPGAFMSMLNSTLLNQTTYNPNINTPADALNFLNQELPKNLRSADGTENIQDGMDIAFCLVDLNKNTLKYAGANNPCWLVRNKELIELKPLKQAITASTEYEKKKFVDQELTLQKGDSIYIFTDGYADQFGGPGGKKFKYKTLNELLISINHEPFARQRQILEDQFNKWKGDLEQVDDVLIMGIKI
jgi:serine phosphatase RsbU (regulator of sigma subunit)